MDGSSIPMEDILSVPLDSSATLVPRKLIQSEFNFQTED
jgi:hypothetical protein